MTIVAVENLFSTQRLYFISATLVLLSLLYYPKMYVVPFLYFYFRKLHAKNIILGVGMLTGLVLLGLLIVIILLWISVFLKNFNTNAVANYNTGLSALIFS